MGRIGRKTWRLAAGGLLVVASPVALGSVAGAECLATLHARPVTVQPGSTVTLYGTNYLGRESVGSSAIRIRMDTRAGPVIASFTPRFTLEGVPVTIPAGTSPGAHTLLAIQYGSTGQVVSCGPGRTSIVVAAARSTGEGTAAPGATSSRQPVDGLALAPLLVMAALEARSRRALRARRRSAPAPA